MKKSTARGPQRPGRHDHKHPKGKPRERDGEEEAVDSTALRPARKEAVLEAFQGVWNALFTSPIHLDSALSKLPTSSKSILAQIYPAILLRPASLAEAIGVGLASNEPWGLSPADLTRWRTARMLADRVYEGMTGRVIQPAPIREDFPPRFLSEWESEWGTEIAMRLVSILGREAPLGLRANRKLGPAELLRRLTKENGLPVRANLSRISPMGLRLDGYAPVLQTGSYEEGGFEIQDEGSQLLALLALWPERYAEFLAPHPAVEPTSSEPAVPPALPEDPPHWTVVDACAGAGGKSLAFADALAGKGRVYSYDTSDKKLQALRRRAKRAGYNNIQAVRVENGKERDVIQKFRRRADVVLVDAPCSGWGVLRRSPDIKWRQAPEVLERMPDLQLRLLSEYSELTRPGGLLTYGVCTFRKAETLEVVRKFQETHPEFVPVAGGFLGPSGCDGFFAQVFRRKGE